MSEVIDTHTARIAALEAQAEVNLQIETALKTALDAATARENQLVAQVAQLQADLAAAQASSVDAATIAALGDRVGVVTQKFADSAVINAPSN